MNNEPPDIKSKQVAMGQFAFQNDEEGDDQNCKSKNKKLDRKSQKAKV